MAQRQALLPLVLLSLTLAFDVNAGTVVLQQQASGSAAYTRVDFGSTGTPQYSSNNQLTSIESSRTGCFGGVLSCPPTPVETRIRDEVGYWVFDLSGVTGEVVSATLQVDAQWTLDTHTHEATFFGVKQDDYDSRVTGLGDHSASAAERYSSFDYSDTYGVSGEGTRQLHTIDLSASAVTQLNSGSTFGLGIQGGWISDFAGGGQSEAYFFGPATLELTLNDVSEVPLPAAFWLFSSAIAVLGFSKRKSNSTT